jgi:creatinine amidohydrolase
VGHVLASLVDQGFRRLVIWRGCGGHDLRQTVERFNEQHSGPRAFLPGLHLRPEMVRRDLISNPSQSPVDWKDPDLDFARHSTSGVR